MSASKALCLLLLAAVVTQITTSASSFRDFSGVVYIPAVTVGKTLGVGWVRIPLYWGEIEPTQGSWVWKKADEEIEQAKAQGLNIVAMLAYTAPWAASLKENSTSPPRRVADWEDFVEHVVSHYSGAPYGLRYFQIWNEPTRTAGFWRGTDDEFIDDIYLPAAKIIRAHKCYVVFGGWPASNTLQEFDSVLSYHGAWQWTDFLDLHYEGLPAWQHLYGNWVRTGKCRGIWETEVGFTADCDFIPRTYLQILHWSLKVGWQRPDEYKLFWYAVWGAGQDAPKCLSENGNQGRAVLTAQGKRLALLSQLLADGPLMNFSNYTIEPSFLAGATVGFKSGQRILIAVMPGKALLSKGQLITVQLFEPPHTPNLKVVSEDGVQLKFEADFGERSLSVKFAPSLPDEPHTKLAVAYVSVSPRSGSTGDGLHSSATQLGSELAKDLKRTF